MKADGVAKKAAFMGVLSPERRILERRVKWGRIYALPI
jgi:hypothetical protein